MSPESEKTGSSFYYDEEIVSLSDKGTGLFIDESNYYQNAYITHWHDGKGFFIYPTGYKMAADRLVKLVANEPHNTDFLVFPIVFLYRQYLELRLKQLLLDGSKLLGISEDFPKTHRIDLLWESCKPVLNKIKLDDDEEVAWEVAKAIGNIEACILEFGRIDPTSMAFRYPVNKENAPSLHGLSVVNINHFGEAMNNITNYLDAVTLALASSLGEHISMAQLGFNDKFSEDFRKHLWLKKQQKQTES